MKNYEGAPFKAYLGATTEEHIVCSGCPDKNETVRLVESIEQKREIATAFHGLLSAHFNKQIRLTLCDDCVERIEKNAETK